MPPEIRVGRLLWSEQTANKLNRKHRLDVEDVRAAIEGVADLRFAWHDDPRRGVRAIIEVDIHGQPHLVVVYPQDGWSGEVWALGSAYPGN